jgi:hypothetical protein
VWIRKVNVLPTLVLLLIPVAAIGILAEIIKESGGLLGDWGPGF